MNRNPSDQYEYWESLKKSFPKEFMKKARERYEKNKEPDLWDRFDRDIKELLKDDADITVSGKKADGKLRELFEIGDSNLDVNMSMKSSDNIMEVSIDFYFNDGNGEFIDSIEMYYAMDDDGSYRSALNDISHSVNYFRERIMFDREHAPTKSFYDVHNEIRNRIGPHTWIDACDSVARNAVTSVKDGYLHERWNSMDVVAENNADDDIFNDSRLFSSDDGNAVVLMTFLDNGPNTDVSFDMYATGACQPDDDSSYCMDSMHRVLPFIDNQGFPFTSRVLLTIKDFLDSSGIRKG